MEGKSLRILLFDGGGVKGLSSLLILQQLMATVDNDNPPKPCDYFDLIGGTSTGGIIAIMLGRLRLTIDECIEAYTTLSGEIFQKRNHRITFRGRIQGRFDTEALEQAIKNVLVKYGFDSDELLRESYGSKCKVAVLAANKHTGDNICLTSYPSPRGGIHLFNTVKIWEACRATSAATSFFDPIKLGPFDEEFVDAAALGVNNPIFSVWAEAQDLWGADQLQNSLRCLVSIGTGVPDLKPFKDDISGIRKTLVAIATETEKTAERFRQNKDSLVKDGLYYRFNVLRGLENIGLGASEKKNEIVAATDRYLRSEEAFSQIKLCALSLSGQAPEQAEIIPAISSAQVQPDVPPQPGQAQKYTTKFTLQGVPVINNYVDRPDDMKALEETLLAERQDNQQKVFVLHGLGGIGKTQLAANFARQYHKRFSSVFWLSGRSANDLKQDLVSCASRVRDESLSQRSLKYLTSGEGNLDAIVIDMMDWLSKTDNIDWLLIFDNADQEYRSDDPETFDLTRYFPGNHGTILITTRLSRLAQLGSSRRLGKVGPDQAKTIYRKWCGNAPGRSSWYYTVRYLTHKVGRIADCEELLQRLDGLPLALAQSAAYIHETGIDPATYLQYYEEQWEEITDLDATSILGYEERCIRTTWLISFNAIRKKDRRAAWLLQLWAFLDNTTLWHGLFDIELEFLKHFPNWLVPLTSSRLSFLSAMKVLLDHSMIEKLQDTDSYSMHPVVHKWAFHIQPYEQRYLARLAVMVIGLRLPERGSKDYWSVARRLLPHADVSSSRLLESVREPDHTLELLEWQYRKTAPIFLHAAQCLADLYRKEGRLGWAERMYSYTLAAKQKVLGPVHPSTLSTMNNFSMLFRDMGDLDEAEFLCQKALETRQVVLGEDDNSTLGSENNLALLHFDRGKFDEAEKLFLRILSIKDATPRGESLTVWRVVNNLGMLYTVTHKYAMAEKMYQRGLGELEGVLGVDHSLTCKVFYNLGLLYAAWDRKTEAKEMLKRALSGREKTLGPDHIFTLDTVSQLGLLCTSQDDTEEGGKLLSQALRGKERVLGADHASAKDAAKDLWDFYVAQGRNKEAEALLGQHNGIKNEPEHQESQQTGGFEQDQRDLTMTGFVEVSWLRDGTSADRQGTMVARDKDPVGAGYPAHVMRKVQRLHRLHGHRSTSTTAK